jgi:conjugal transfer pilus assembly protein TraK
MQKPPLHSKMTLLSFAVLGLFVAFTSSSYSQDSGTPERPLLGTISLKTGAITANSPTTKDDSDTQKGGVKTLKLRPAPPASNEVMLPPPPKRIEADVFPGIGIMPGDPPELKNKVVKNSNERNEIVYISLQFPNRISTPFLNPQVIDKSNAGIEIVGSDVYVTPKSNEPIGIYITDEAARQVISLTLVPKNIPQQTLVAQLDTKIASNSSNLPSPSDYVGKIDDLMRTIAQDKAPAGFTQANLPRSVSRNGDLIIAPQARYSGTTYDIFKYQLTSAAKTNIELQEERFYNQENIRAISFFPATVLSPGGTTTMIVITDRIESVQ